MSVVTLYSRTGCHLCDEAREAIGAMRPELPDFELREVDIESDDGLFTRLLERIPVVEIDGEVVSELELDHEAVRLALGRGGP